MNAQQRRRQRRQEIQARRGAPSALQMETVSPERTQLAVTTSDMERKMMRRTLVAVSAGVAFAAAMVAALFALLSVLL